jgi:hypothetical protein
MRQMLDLKAPAKLWVRIYGDEAPARIREWAESPFQSREAADCLERIAQIAEAFLAERRIDLKVAI